MSLGPGYDGAFLILYLCILVVNVAWLHTQSRAHCRANAAGPGGRRNAPPSPGGRDRFQRGRRGSLLAPGRWQVRQGSARYARSCCLTQDGGPQPRLATTWPIYGAARGYGEPSRASDRGACNEPGRAAPSPFFGHPAYSCARVRRRKMDDRRTCATPVGNLTECGSDYRLASLGDPYRPTQAGGHRRARARDEDRR